MSLRRNALLLATLTTLLAIIGGWSGNDTLAGLWRLPLALLLLGLAYEAWLATRAHLTMSIEGRSAQYALGRASSLRVTLSQQLARDVTIEIAPEAPPAVQIDAGVQTVVVPADGAADLDVIAVPRQLGRHSWPRARARIAGPLGLAWWTRPVATQFEMHVTPDLLGNDAQRVGAAGSGTTARPMLGAGGEILQLRAYRPGDPQHVIDWKATARSGQLVSRDFSEDQHLEIVIAIDAGRLSAVRAGDLDRFGHYANIAARFAEHAVVQDDQVGLVIFADRVLATIPPGRGIATVSRIRATLAAARPAAAESNPLNAALRIRTLARHRSLVIMLTDLDDVTVAGQLASAARLLLPKHLPLIAGLSSPEVQSLRVAPAHTWLDPYQALAAQDYDARLELNAAGLRALGAPTLLARPQQMERAVFEAYTELRQRRRI